MGYLLRETRLSLEEIKAKSIDNYIEEVIAMDVDNIIEQDLEDFCYGIVYKLIGDRGDIEDLEWEVVGTGLDRNIIHVKVSGYVILAGEE